MTGDEPGPPPGTYWDELEKSFADLEAAQQLHPSGGPEGHELFVPTATFRIDAGRLRRRIKWAAWTSGALGAVGNPLWILRGHGDLTRSQLAVDWFLHGIGIGVGGMLLAGSAALMILVGRAVRQ